jgi:nucleoside 2-deoxyribosyltransferase
MPKIYVAGPLFTEGERWLLERIDEACRQAGYETYLPHRDAGVFDRDSDSSFFFQQDLHRLQEADVVVAVLNGFDVDSGTAWEMGYFYALGKRAIIGYLHDSRLPHPEAQINPMVVNSLQALVHDLEALTGTLATLSSQ